MRIPPLKPRTLAKALRRAGFRPTRQKGSHQFWRHADGRTTILAQHSGRLIDGDLVAKIVKEDLKMTRKEFLRLLR